VGTGGCLEESKETPAFSVQASPYASPKVLIVTNKHRKEQICKDNAHQVQIDGRSSETDAHRLASLHHHRHHPLPPPFSYRPPYFDLEHPTGMPKLTVSDAKQHPSSTRHVNMHAPYSASSTIFPNIQPTDRIRVVVHWHKICW
jgi:hypothetical protein